MGRWGGVTDEIELARAPDAPLHENSRAVIAAIRQSVVNSEEWRRSRSMLVDEYQPNGAEDQKQGEPAPKDGDDREEVANRLPARPRCGYQVNSDHRAEKKDEPAENGTALCDATSDRA